MRLPCSYTQLRAVVFVLVLFTINLASPADISKEAKEDLDKELKPFIDSAVGYLPAMPIITVHSVLVSFMAEEYNKTTTNATFEFTNGVPKGFRNAEVAASMAVYLKQMRPFKEDPFSNELMGPLLERIAKEVTSDNLTAERDQLSQRNQKIQEWHESNVTDAAGKLTLAKKDWNNCSADWKVLAGYPVSRWYQYEVDKANLDEDDVFCIEAALRWMAFDKVKESFQEGKKLFQSSLDDFLKYQNDDKTPEKLIAYTIQLGAHLGLLNDTGNEDLQAEFQALLVDPSKASPQVEKFQNFLNMLGLVTGTFDKQALAFKFGDQDLSEPNVDPKVPAGYFEMLSNTSDVPAMFTTIFKGFKQYRLSLVGSDDDDLFKWHHRMQFIASHGHMYKKRVLEVVKPSGNVPEPTTTPPTGNQDRQSTTSVHPQVQTVDSGTCGNLMNQGKDAWNQTKACWSSLPLWGQVGSVVVALAVIIGGPIWYSLSGNPTTTLTTLNPFGEATTSAAFLYLPPVIVVLSVVAFLALGAGAGWWCFSRRKRAKRSETSLEETNPKKPKKMKRKAYNAMTTISDGSPSAFSTTTESPSTAFSMMTQVIEPQTTRSPTISMVSTSKGKPKQGKVRTAVTTTPVTKLSTAWTSNASNATSASPSIFSTTTQCPTTMTTISLMDPSSMDPQTGLSTFKSYKWPHMDKASQAASPPRMTMPVSISPVRAKTPTTKGSPLGRASKAVLLSPSPPQVIKAPVVTGKMKAPQAKAAALPSKQKMNPNSALF